MDSLCDPPAAFDVDDAPFLFSLPSAFSLAPSAPSSFAFSFSSIFSLGSTRPSATTSVVTTALLKSLPPNLPTVFVLKLPIRCPFQFVNRCCFFNLSARLENLCGFIRFRACAPFGPLLFCPSFVLFGFSGATLLARDFRSSCAMSAWLRAIFLFRSSSYSVKFASFSSMAFDFFFSKSRRKEPCVYYVCACVYIFHRNIYKQPPGSAFKKVRALSFRNKFEISSSFFQNVWGFFLFRVARIQTTLSLSLSLSKQRTKNNARARDALLYPALSRARECGFFGKKYMSKKRALV